MRRVIAGTNSSDSAVRLEAEVAKRFSKSLVGFREKVFRAGLELGEKDVELENAIIEVTGGGGGRKVGQVQKLLSAEFNPAGKAVIVFGPNIRAGTARAIEAAGARVEADREQIGGHAICNSQLVIILGTLLLICADRDSKSKAGSTTSSLVVIIGSLSSAPKTITSSCSI